MSNAKKILEGKAEKPARQPRTRKVKIDLKSMPDAVVDGKMTVDIKGKVFFERRLMDAVEVHEGYIFSIDGDTVSIFDETREQFYCVNLKEKLPVIKKLV